MCTLAIDGYSEVWRQQLRTSRKARVCDCCSTRIAVGTRYLSHFSVYDGETTTGELCLACSELQERFGAAHRAAPSPNALYDELQECVGERLKAGDRSAPTEWAPEFAAVKRRRRVSPVGRRDLRATWALRAARRAGLEATL